MLKQTFVFGLCVVALVPQLLAQDGEASTTTMTLAEGQLTLQAPKDWKSKTPRFRNITKYEFSAPADAKPDEPSARITVTQSGGSIDANIERWYGQFLQPDGKATKDVAKTEKFEVAGNTVYLVDISGTYETSMGGGPFAPGPKVKQADYRMLGAIITTKNAGNYFIKMTGPQKTLKELAEGFKKMLKDMKAAA